MRAKELIQDIIGAGVFVLEDITVNTGMNEIKLAVRPTKRERRRYGIRHRKARRYDRGRSGAGVAWMWVRGKCMWRRSSYGCAARNTAR